jgi:hypothetical protein
MCSSANGGLCHQHLDTLLATFFGKKKFSCILKKLRSIEAEKMHFNVGQQISSEVLHLAQEAEFYYSFASRDSYSKVRSNDSLLCLKSEVTIDSESLKNFKELSQPSLEQQRKMIKYSMYRIVRIVVPTQEIL